MATKWIAYDFDRTPLIQFERRPGCYVVYLDGIIRYVGQSTNVQKRILSHRIRVGYSSCYLTPWGEADTVIVKVRYSERYGDWAMRELRLIRWFNPAGNKVGKLVHT